MTVRDVAHEPARSGRRRVLGYLDDLMWLAIILVLFPVAILAIGMPVVLLARLVVEIAQRW